MTRMLNKNLMVDLDFHIHIQATGIQIVLSAHSFYGIDHAWDAVSNADETVCLNHG